MRKNAPSPDPSGEYQNLVDLLAIVSECEARLKSMEADLQSEFLEAVDTRRKEYSDLQQKQIEAEQSIELIARKHPEWFASRRSLKTPYGAVNFRKSTKLVVANEEVSILLIQQRSDEEPPSVSSASRPGSTSSTGKAH